MIVVWDTDGSGGVWERLGAEIARAVPGEPVCRQLTLAAFSERLARERRHVVAAVVVIARDAELVKLGAIRDLLSDVRLIMVLPDGDRETSRAAHTFYPRYIAGLDDGFRAVGAILRKMSAGASRGIRG